MNLVVCDILSIIKIPLFSSDPWLISIAGIDIGRVKDGAILIRKDEATNR